MICSGKTSCLLAFKPFHLECGYSGKNNNNNNKKQQQKSQVSQKFTEKSIAGALYGTVLTQIEFAKAYDRNRE